jgi:hypothetical protein
MGAALFDFWYYCGVRLILILEDRFQSITDSINDLGINVED